MAKGRLLFGLIITGIGLVLLTQNLFDINLWEICGRFWPAILIGWGLLILTEPGNSAKIVGGVLAMLGLAFLGNNLDWYEFSVGSIFRLFWPVVLIGLGIRFLTGAGRGQTNLALLGGIDRTQGPWQLTNDSFWAMLGGITLDLRHATVTESEIKLNLTALLGSIEVIVPPDLTVCCDGTALLGGLELFGKSNGGIIANLRVAQDGGDLAPEACAGLARQRVHLNCLAILGGVEVKTATR